MWWIYHGAINGGEFVYIEIGRMYVSYVSVSLQVKICYEYGLFYYLQKTLNQVTGPFSEPQDGELLHQRQIAFISPFVSRFMDRGLGSESSTKTVSKKFDSWPLIGPNHGHGGSLRQESTSIKGPHKPIQCNKILVMNEWCCRNYTGAVALQTNLFDLGVSVILIAPPSFVQCDAPFVLLLQMFFLR